MNREFRSSVIHISVGLIYIIMVELLQCRKECATFSHNRIGIVMVSVLASHAVDCVFEPRSGLAKDYKIGICCFSTKHTVLKRKSNDWLAMNQDSVSELGNMSIHRLLFQ
jgi:hypothetical protein